MVNDSFVYLQHSDGAVMDSLIWNEFAQSGMFGYIMWDAHFC